MKNYKENSILKTESNPNQKLNTEISSPLEQFEEVSLKDINNFQQTSHQLLYTKIINILFIIGGVLFIFRSLQGAQKIDIILAPIGILFTFFISIIKPLMNEKDIFLTLTLSIWIIISYFITFQTDIEVLFILILIGFLIIKYLSQEYVSNHLQKRLNIVILILSVVFFLIIIEKIQIILTK